MNGDIFAHFSAAQRQARNIQKILRSRELLLAPWILVSYIASEGSENSLEQRCLSSPSIVTGQRKMENHLLALNVYVQAGMYVHICVFVFV